jgi:hypothetical protein
LDCGLKLLEVDAQQFGLSLNPKYEQLQEE